jgi:TetR/AcrR family transcriptional repressor of mexJK operon
MPRAPGQVDEAKTRAILDAARALFSERGYQVSMEEIARSAGVSRQTVYNRFPSKTELGRAMARRWSDAISTALDSDQPPEAVLTALATALLEKFQGTGGSALRGLALTSPDAPEMAAAVYDAGPGQTLARLTRWLDSQARAGRLDIQDPAQAAEAFLGSVIGYGHLRAVLGVAHPAVDVPARAAEAARRFLKAYAASIPA